MPKTLKKIVQVLDGKPTGMRGQSMAELALTLPIFLIMIIGLTEVGWFANNYLILTDVVRSAGRYGSIHDPLDWQEGDEKNVERLDCDVVGTGINGENVFTSPQDLPSTDIYAVPISGGGFINGGESSSLGYYDGVACDALVNMLPLQFKFDEDDIVVSVFSYVTMANCGGGPCVRLAGRYPSGANECSEDTFDPFDIDRDGVKDPFEDNARFDGSSSEGYRGYVFRGNQVSDSDANCIGSDFSNQRMEDLLNSTMLESDITQEATAGEIGFVPNYGLVLVEMQWNSYQLLGLPFFTMFTWIDNPIRIRVWSIFPVSAAEVNVDCWNHTPCEIVE